MEIFLSGVVYEVFTLFKGFNVTSFSSSIKNSTFDNSIYLCFSYVKYLSVLSILTLVTCTYQGVIKVTQCSCVQVFNWCLFLCITANMCVYEKLICESDIKH